jgi:chemotaxis family two-component system response regulator Rcp1
MRRETVGRPIEILLVEDNLEDAGITIRALRQEDFQCRVSLVKDGEEALEFLNRLGVFAKAPRPDLILLDMQLPKRDGRQVLADIRGDEQLRGIPVVVLTASRVHKAILEGEKLHVDGYLTKPVSLKKFIDLVKSLRRSWLAEIVLPELDY